jgi:hypothetical protein
MHCRVRYLFDFDLKIRSGQVCPPLNLPPAQPAAPPPLILPTAPPTLLHAPHENNKGGARTPKNDKRKKWPHERPAFKAAAAANSVVDLLNPGGQSARLDDATF